MPILYADVDETLIYSRSQVPGSVSFRFENDNYDSYTIARPSAKPFLHALKDKGYVIHVCTQGLVQFQRHCLQLLDLDRYISEYYGYLDPHDLSQINYPRLNEDDKAVLIDNLHWKEVGLKLSWFNIRPTLFTCVPFYGLEDEDMNLMQFLPKIEEFFSHE